MWFKNSFIPIAAAVILAMDSENYIAASIFFSLGLLERMVERKEEDDQD